MKPYPIHDSDSFQALLGTVKAGFPSPADDFREKLDLVKLLVQHSASTFFFQIDGVSMVDADMDEGDIIIVDRAVEPYSIDECFLDLAGMEGMDFDTLAKTISRECWKQTSIPVSVGIAPTKTLAKIASKLCKKYPKLRGGCYMFRPKISRRCFGSSLRRMFGASAVVPCGSWRGWALCPPGTIRSFSHDVTSLQEFTEQITTFAGKATEKLRAQHSFALEMVVFTKIEQNGAHVSSLFEDSKAQEKDERLSCSIDSINKVFGPGAVLFGVQGDGRFHMPQEHKSPRYTTRWTELPKVSVK